VPRPATPGSHDLLATVTVGLAAALISLARLWLGNHAAITEVVWAEDGVLPLCVHKVGFLTCLVDPFAGYLMFLPRLVAGFVALLPVGSWALATNLLAAGMAGLTAGIAFSVVRRFGLGVISAVLVGLLPVIAPVVGLEAINALGSSYMLLLYLSILVLAFPVKNRFEHWLPTSAFALLALLTTLTIPTGGVIVALAIVQGLRRSIPWRAVAVWVSAAFVGLAAQWLTAVDAAKPRIYLTSMHTFNGWLAEVPNTVLTYWPGMRLAEYTMGYAFTVSPLGVTGAIVVLGIVAGGVVLIVRGGDERAGIGLLMLSGIVVGAVPAIIGGNNNRYFVVPLLLWGAAVAVSLDQVIRRSRPWVVVATIAAILLVWSPALAASDFRSTPAPPWSDEVARIEAKCKADPPAKERVTFSPFWPPNSGDALSEPTHPDVSCFVVWKQWLN
jgi:hypothetical protein